MPNQHFKHLTTQETSESAEAAVQRQQQVSRDQESTFHAYGASLDKPSSPERDRVFALVRALDPKALIELTALMWLGRGANGETADKWPQIIALATTQQKSSDNDHAYVAGNPFLATCIADGLQKLEAYEAHKNA